MWLWLKSNGGAVEAVCAVIVAMAAVAALIGVKMQIDSAERLQQQQQAREIYREFLNISIQNPALRTANYCALPDARQRAAYEDYVEYLIYTSEQVITMDPSWTGPMTDALADHAPYICARSDWSDHTLTTSRIIERVQREYCPITPEC